MKKLLPLVVILTSILTAETLFEVKDSLNNKVLDVSTDGLRIMNAGDTLMVISTSEIKANLSNSKGLSRSFSVSTTTSKGTGNDLMRLTGDSTRFWISDTGSGFGVAKQTVAKTGDTNLLEVLTSDTKMREGSSGEKYTDFNTTNMFIGLNAGRSNLSGADNVFIGNYSGYENTSGQHNVYLGMSSGRLNQTNGGNVYLGSYAGEENTKGGNTFVGMFAGKDSGGVGGGGSSTFVGYASGRTAYGGSNTFIGMSSGNMAGDGSENVFIGSSAGFQATSGSGNVYVGHYAGFGWNTNPGNDNIYIGKSSGLYSNGNNNVFLGSSSGMLNTGSSNVFLGYSAGYNETGSNKLYVANSGTSNPIIKGTFPNTDLSLNATDIYANGKITIKGGTSIGMAQAGTMTIGNFTGQSSPKIITYTFPKVFSSVPKITVTPKGANGVNELFGVTVRDITTTNCVVMVYKLYPTAGGSWTQNLLADWVAWE
jgi:hypothetical protein